MSVLGLPPALTLAGLGGGGAPTMPVNGFDPTNPAGAINPNVTVTGNNWQDLANQVGGMAPQGGGGVDLSQMYPGYSPAKAYNTYMADYGQPSMGYDPWASGGYTQMSPGAGPGAYGGYGMAGGGGYGGGGYGGGGGGYGNIISSGQNALASMYGANQGLLGTQNTNQANQNIAGTNALTQLGLGGMNMKNVAGTNTANQNIASTQANAAMQQALDQLMGTGVTAQANQNIAGIQNVPALARLQFMQQLFGQGGAFGGILSGLGLGGGSQGAGGMGVGLGNVGGGTTGGTGGTPPSSTQPAVAQSQPMNALQMQQNLGAGQSAIDQHYADLRNNLLQQQGSRGLSGAGGLNPGLEAQISQRQNQDVMGNNLNWENFASQLNNQNNLAYNAQNLGQYNANQNRALQALGLTLPYTAGQASAGFGLLSGMLGAV